MDDNKIVELYWERREEAIKETALKYGRLCTHIAKNILLSCEDSEEYVNDTYFAVWNAIPNERPNRFSAYSKIKKIGGVFHEEIRCTCFNGGMCIFIGKLQ